MPGLHQSFHNEASSAESEAEDSKPTGLDLHKDLDVDARFDKWLAGSCKYKRDSWTQLSPDRTTCTDPARGRHRGGRRQAG